MAHSIKAGSYGYPSESRHPLNSVTLDLPGTIAYVASTNSEKQALYAIGPFPEDVNIHDRSLWQHLPHTYPSTRSWDGYTATFVFPQLLQQGTYRIAVHPSRIRIEDGQGGGPPELYSEDGTPWDGWFLTVFDDKRTLESADPVIQGDPDLIQDPSLIGTATQGVTQTVPVAITVSLDGKNIRQGASELSGEILTVEAPKGSNVEIQVESFRAAQTTLWERYAFGTAFDTEDDDTDLWVFSSAGPIEDYEWAVYHGTDTEARLPINKAGRLLITTPVIRAPKTEDPLLIRESEEATDASGNTYQVTRFLVTPHYQNVLAEDVDFYSKPIVVPITLVDPTNTPATNPHRFQEIGAAGGEYRSDLSLLTDSTKVASFDLPLAARVRVLVDGVERWWGQTRLIPLGIRPSAWAAVGGPRVLDGPDLANARLAIWQATMEAAALWPCRIPPYVPRTWEAYILTRLQMGWPYGDGMIGSVSIRVGDTMFSGKSDDLLLRRLDGLAELLMQCIEDGPLWPEDHLPATSAYYGSDAFPTHYPRHTMEDVTKRYAPTTNSNMDPTERRSLFDPPQHRRPLR